MKAIEETSQNNNYKKGIIYVLIAAFCFSLMTLFIRLAGDINFVQKSFFRNFVAAIIAFVILKKKKVKYQWKGHGLGLFGRCFFGTAGVFCNFYAVDRLNISDANLLNKLSPFFAILFSFLLLKEKIKPHEIACVVLAFVGALFVLRPFGHAVHVFPAVIGLCSGLGAGIAYTFVRKITAGTKENPKGGIEGPVIVVTFSVFSCLAALPYFILHFDPMSGYQVLILLLCGLAAAGGQFAITAAYTYAPAKEISVYDYTQIIFAAVLGFFFLGQIPDKWSYVGYIIIFMAAILRTVYHPKEKRKQ